MITNGATSAAAISASVVSVPEHRRPAARAGGAAAPTAVKSGRRGYFSGVHRRHHFGGGVLRRRLAVDRRREGVARRVKHRRGDAGEFRARIEYAVGGQHRISRLRLHRLVFGAIGHRLVRRDMAGRRPEQGMVLEPLDDFEHCGVFLRRLWLALIVGDRQGVRILIGAGMIEQHRQLDRAPVEQLVLLRQGRPSSALPIRR